MIFQAIVTFVNDLGEFFAKDSHPLALYERLLNKTTEEHTEAVEKHIAAFRKFCLDNKDNILSKTPVFTDKIQYSPRVYIDMNEIFNLTTDNDTRAAIWQHLLTLQALIDPHSGALSVLKSNDAKVSDHLPKIEGEGEEGDFLNDIIKKVEHHVTGDTSNPQEAIASIMSSGLITDLVGSLNNGISSGKLDLSKMMSSVQKMVGSMTADMGDSADDPNMSMLNNMMGMLNNMTGKMP